MVDFPNDLWQQYYMSTANDVPGDPTIANGANYNAVIDELGATQAFITSTFTDNAVTNATPIKDTAGWALYADAAGATPVDGIGGVANLTWARSATAPLSLKYSFLLTKDAVNRQGEGVAYTLTLPLVQRGVSTEISFEYGSGGAYASGDCRVYVYDVTGTTLITPDVVDIPSGTGVFSTVFAATSSSQYRLVFHTASTNASAWTLKLNRVRVGRSTSLDPDLLAIAALGSTGYLRRSNTNTWVLDTSLTTGQLGFGSATGATVGSADLTFNSTTGVLATKYLNLDTAAAVPTHAEGRAYWDTVDHCFSIMSEVSGSVLCVGQENWIRIVNKTGAQLNDGEVVYLSGAQGNRPTAALAIATSGNSDRTIGLVTNNIADNAEGYVTVFGIVHGYDTSLFTAGDPLYVSAGSAGQLTNVAPVAPNHAIRVGYALNSTNNGMVFVNTHEGAELTHLHDVLLTAPANKDALRYVTAQTRWENTNQGAWLDTAQTFTAAQTITAVLDVNHATTGNNAALLRNTHASGYGPVFRGGGGSTGLYCALFQKYDGTEAAEITDTGLLEIHNGLTVSAGTTAMQAATCTTLTASSGTEGTPAIVAIGAGTSQGRVRLGSAGNYYGIRGGADYLATIITANGIDALSLSATGDATFAAGVSCTTLTASGDFYGGAADATHRVQVNGIGTGTAAGSFFAALAAGTSGVYLGHYSAIIGGGANLHGLLYASSSHLYTYVGGSQIIDATASSVVLGTDPGGNSLLRLSGSITMSAGQSIYSGGEATANLRCYFDASNSYWRAPSGGHVWQNESGTNRMTLDSSGNLTASGTVTASGTFSTSLTSGSGFTVTSSAASGVIGFGATATNSTATVRMSLTNDLSRNLWVLYSGSAYASSVFGKNGEFGLVGTVGAYPLHLGTNSAVSLTINTDQSATFANTVFINGASSLLRLDRAGSGNASYILMCDTTDTKHNWMAGAQYNVDNGYEITRNATVGSSTYNVIGLKFDGSVNCTFPTGWIKLDNATNSTAYNVGALVVAGGIASAGANNVFAGSLGLGAVYDTASRLRVQLVSTAATTVTGTYTDVYVRPGSAAATNFYGASSLAQVDQTNANASGATLFGQASTAAISAAGNSSVTSLIGTWSSTPVINSGTTGTLVTAANAYGLYVQPTVSATNSGAVATLTNFYGVFLSNATLSGAGTPTITNRYGVYQQDTAAKNYFAGIAGFGVVPTASAGLIQMPAGTTAAGGIAFGSDSLYRSAAGQLTIDTTGTPSLRLKTASNVYANITFSPFGADQVVLNGSSYGLEIAGTYPYLHIGYSGNLGALGLAVNGSAAFGANALVSAERARFAGGTIATPGATDVCIGGGAIYSGAGITSGGLLLTTLSGTGGAMFRLPHGAAPTSPVNGDVWTTTAGMYARINGGTAGPFLSGTASLDSVAVGTSTGLSTVTGFTASTGGFSFTQAVRQSGGIPSTGFNISNATLSSMPASTECPFIVFDLARTITWNAGALTTQREVKITAPTYAFASASTLTTAATVSITGAPTAGTNATITTALALWIEAGCLQTAASTTTVAGLRAPHGSAPSAPKNGDIWTTTAGLFVQINGVTKTVTLT